jgi:hypothetical protein
MARKKQSRGKCLYCGREMTRGGLAKHLSECAKRQEAIAAADKGTGKEQPIYHLQVQDAYDGAFWLHLEMNGEATLTKLDHYLRAIWLECCGHMSEFYLGRAYGHKVGMARKAEQVFSPGVQLTHIYDFGTSSETQINVVAVRKGRPTTKHAIALMARNDMPETVCMECGEPATRLCIECLQELGETGELCEEHAEAHPHENYGEPMNLVNSPRTGMCGYDGPAEPPY